MAKRPANQPPPPEEPGPSRRQDHNANAAGPAPPGGRHGLQTVAAASGRAPITMALHMPKPRRVQQEPAITVDLSDDDDSDDAAGQSPPRNEPLALEDLRDLQPPAGFHLDVRRQDRVDANDSEAAISFVSGCLASLRRVQCQFMIIDESETDKDDASEDEESDEDEMELQLASGTAAEEAAVDAYSAELELIGLGNPEEGMVVEEIVTSQMPEGPISIATISQVDLDLPQDRAELMSFQRAMQSLYGTSDHLVLTTEDVDMSTIMNMAEISGPDDIGLQMDEARHLAVSSSSVRDDVGLNFEMMGSEDRQFEASDVDIENQLCVGDQLVSFAQVRDSDNIMIIDQGHGQGQIDQVGAGEESLFEKSQDEENEPGDQGAGQGQGNDEQPGLVEKMGDDQPVTRPVGEGVDKDETGKEVDEPSSIQIQVNINVDAVIKDAPFADSGEVGAKSREPLSLRPQARNKREQELEPKDHLVRRAPFEPKEKRAKKECKDELEPGDVFPRKPQIEPKEKRAKKELKEELEPEDVLPRRPQIQPTEKGAKKELKDESELRDVIARRPQIEPKDKRAKKELKDELEPLDVIPLTPPIEPTQKKANVKEELVTASSQNIDIPAPTGSKAKDELSDIDLVDQILWQVPQVIPPAVPGPSREMHRVKLELPHELRSLSSILEPLKPDDEAIDKLLHLLIRHSINEYPDGTTEINFKGSRFITPLINRFCPQEITARLATLKGVILVPHAKLTPSLSTFLQFEGDNDVRHKEINMVKTSVKKMQKLARESFLVFSPNELHQLAMDKGMDYFVLWKEMKDGLNIDELSDELKGLAGVVGPIANVDCFIALNSNTAYPEFIAHQEHLKFLMRASGIDITMVFVDQPASMHNAQILMARRMIRLARMKGNTASP